MISIEQNSLLFESFRAAKFSGTFLKTAFISDTKRKLRGFPKLYILFRFAELTESYYTQQL